MAVLFISAELEEVLRLSHRIGVLRDRRLVAAAGQRATTLTTERIMDDHRERRHQAASWRR